MGRELSAGFEVFRRELDRCAEILRPHLGLDLREVLYPPGRDWQKPAAGGGIDLRKMLGGNTQAPEDEDSRRLNRAVHLQPALFSVEYALARLWSDLGIEPAALVGHSMGEYVAACLAGVFSLEDALRLIVRRTQLVDRLEPARMLAVPLPEAELEPMLPPELSIALINGPRLCVVAGPPAAVEEFAQTLTARGVLTRAVQNTHAFHSRWLDPVVEAFAAEVRQIRLSPPKIPFISNLTGRWITAPEATDPAYWASHLNHTARFHDALATLWQMEGALFLEAGPGGTLGVLANQHPAKPPHVAPMAVSSLRHHYENRSDLEGLLQACGKLWLAGVEPRWANLHRGERRKKIPLPTYPFERQNFWLEAQPSPAAEVPRPEPGLLEIDRWFHVPSWERTAGFDDAPADAVRPDLLWLIFADRRGDDHGFRAASNRGTSAIELVRFGKGFALAADGSTEIDPRSFADYLELFRRIKEAGWAAVNVIHLGCIGHASAAQDRFARADAADFSFFSLLQIAQAMGELALGLPVNLGVISSGFHSVIGDEELDPSMTAALGLCGVIPREYPDIACFNVDLPARAGSATVDATHRRWIRAEFARPATGEILAYRGRHRWRRKYISVALPPAQPAPGPGAPRTDRLRERGVYLITGGTGAIGLAVARHLAQSCRARIVLTRRTPFPEKSQWPELRQSADTSSGLARTLRQLEEIEGLGAEVEVMAADVSDREAMRAVLAAARTRFGAIHGVIHGAGIVRPGLVQTKDRAVAESVLAPKVAGTWILHDLLAETELDFLVLFSSMTGVATPIALADYSGANAFLDAFAHFAQSQGPRRVLSIDWPGWKDAGMLAELKPAPGMEAWMAATLSKSILARDGIEAFQRALASPFPQVVVSPTDLAEELRPPDNPLALAPAELAPDQNSGQDIESVVSRIWAQAFGLPGIGPDEKFTDLGGHSLLALQIVTRVRSYYGVNVTLRDFFGAATVAQLSALIEDKVIEDISRLTDEEVRDSLSAASEQSD
jgi:malonyl CoA-acyl carrier protein transacylase/NAD(P)-dependent dehydrogenase (short-subunit alcohol dehydrogenase family)/acyl carrier protein